MSRLHSSKNRNDDEPLIVGHYSVDQIKAFNANHDRKLGWQAGQGNFYTNVFRLPESHFGPADGLWDGKAQ
jgi:hypothetical protein